MTGVAPFDSSRAVTLVIPGRNCAATLGACLDATVPLLADGQLSEIIFINDASTDATRSIAARYPVTIIDGSGRGAGSARNLGWRAAKTPLIWFVDSDCVAAPDALAILLSHIERHPQPQPDSESPPHARSAVAGVGGSYLNMRPESLLASLIHEEIVERHDRMRPDVDFLATFNVLYRRAVLVEVGGFDERFIKAQDAELAYRIRRAGHRLRFDRRSLVGHFHLDRLRPYLRVQRQQGYWRAWLYAVHPERLTGDSYSGFSDHIQPPLALAMLGLSPLLAMGPLALVEGALFAGLMAAQVPMTARLVGRTKDLRYAAFAGLSAVRAFERGVGFAHGTVAAAWSGASSSAVGKASAR